MREKGKHVWSLMQAAVESSLMVQLQRILAGERYRWGWGL